MIYCQYVYGIGHFVRAVELARGLSARFEVYLVSGGEAVPNFDVPASVTIIQLPAVYKNEADNFLSPVDPSQSLEQCFQLRETLLSQLVQSVEPDILITEHFPFGLLFEKEATGLMQQVKRANPAVKIVCSVRDIIESSKGGGNDSYTCELINKWFDLVLVHGDKEFAPLATSFPKVGSITVPVVQTGYITRRIYSENKSSSIPTILVSVAGGRLGLELLEAVTDSHLEVKARINHRMILFSGAFQQDFDKQQRKVSSLSSNGITIQVFDRERYLQALAGASLVISLGGYNSIIESVSAGKSLLVYNRDFAGNNKEQDLRIRLFEQAGFLNVLTIEDLNNEKLSCTIINKLNSPEPTQDTIDVDGVKASCERLASLLVEQSR